VVDFTQTVSYYLAVPHLWDIDRNNGAAVLPLLQPHKTHSFNMKCPKCKDTGVIRYIALPDTEFSNWCECEVGDQKLRIVVSIISPMRQPFAAKGSKP
jgi:hypothetical protein